MSQRYIRRGPKADFSAVRLSWATPALGLVLILAAVAAGCGNSEKTPAKLPFEERSVGAWPTWVLTSPASVTVSPPPGPGSSAGKADLAEVRRLARQRDAAATAIVRRWAEQPPTLPWTELNLELVSGGQIDPPLASRGYALVSVAMYDAVVAAWYWKYRYQRPPPQVAGALLEPGPDPSYPSEHAVIAGAASRVLSYLFPERPPGDFDRMAEEAALSRVAGGANYPSDVEAGLALGRAVADAVIARARDDGSQRTWNGRRRHGTRFWAPPPGTDAPPAQPLAGTWQTWALTSGAQFRPPPPPSFDSPRFIAETREVIELDAKLTPEQKRIAKFWEGGVGTPLPPGVWNQVATAYVRRDRLTTPKAAKVFALLNVAMADAGVAVWDAKYAYWSPRPENAIRDLGLEADWSPFLATPAFPSYVSAHSAYSTAAAEVLAALFPRDARQFRAKAEEAGLSRLYGGIHFRADHEAGVWMGRKIGRLVIADNSAGA